MRQRLHACGGDRAQLCALGQWRVWLGMGNARRFPVPAA